ncbi:hypothetical protein [Microvirga alba]|uniref:DUF883 family protein n=1 Tax=Microvirga alba TaxID=2791025 RepID=A0A931FT92_9HYPH|nr:hypothetical protein [Microvirga alba]MBF9234471.1 hypothetical protein [Microvirga alba]
MGDHKSESDKSSSAKQAGSEAASGANISAGTSVGNVGQSPMPHTYEEASPRSQPGKAHDAAARVREAASEARHKAAETYEEAAEWAEDTYGRVSDWASDAYERQHDRMGHMRDRSAKTFSDARNSVQRYVAENPMVVGLVGLAAGLLLGALLPRTRRENQTFGEWSDEVRERGVQYARDAAKRGREYVEEALEGEDPRARKREGELRRDSQAERH